MFRKEAHPSRESNHGNRKNNHAKFQTESFETIQLPALALAENNHAKFLENIPETLSPKP